jgi:hypothetical protein
MSLPRSSIPGFGIAALFVGLVVAMPALAAPVLDGVYSGKLECGALMGNPSNAGWSSPVELHVDGESVSWLRGSTQFQESGQALWRSNGVDVDAAGAYAPGAGRQNRWRTTGSLRLNGATLSGAMRQTSPSGDQVFRNCSASFTVSLRPAAARRDGVPTQDARTQATEECAWKGGAACRSLAAAEGAASDPMRQAAGTMPATDSAPGTLRNPGAPQAGATATPAGTAPAGGVAEPMAGDAQRAEASAQPATPRLPLGAEVIAVPATTVVVAEATPAAGGHSGTVTRYVAFGEFGEYWILWVIVGAVLTLYLPLSFLLSGPSAAVDQLSAFNLLDIFNRTGQVRPHAAAAQSLLMVGLFAIAMVLIGPLIIWFSAGVPMAHRTDDASVTLCCVESPEFTQDRRLAIDLYRDDPVLPWYMVKTILTGKGNGPWKLRVIDTAKGQFVDLTGFGKTEDRGSTLVLGRNEAHLKAQFPTERLRILDERSAAIAVDLRADAMGFQLWPVSDQSRQDSVPQDDEIERARKAKTGFTVGDVTRAGARTRLLVAREKPDHDGLLGAVKALWGFVAAWEHFAWIDADTGQVRRKATLFGRARHVGSTPDGAAQIFVATGGYLKLVRTPELQLR